MPPSTMKIKLGESGTQFLQRNHLDSRGNVNRQPAGLNFYQHRWSTTYPGTVYVENGIHSFEIQHVVSITGTEDAEKLGEGISDFSIRALISQNRPTPHDEARLAFITLLQTHWVDMVKKLKRTRYAIEEKLIRQGYTIDTGYVEPIVHPADPVEP